MFRELKINSFRCFDSEAGLKNVHVSLVNE